ncbi:MFS transporter [Aliidongia dinghuensis]|uniref:Putative tartrate transporter n=1 Tax=Aliidongia dinghuensis TaxID=1867774 RepID=A0A8J3E2H6_9PROT|nr:MFS transporter [Aliidongia dinghuensis]GGF10378.1 MFS transporter [Aliidongia dinghuensis]
MDKTLEQRTIRKISWRLLPLIVVIYFVAYIDRTNVSFASFGMTRDLGLDAYIYGWGAGIFFLGYFLFEVPSNLMLERFGARRWIARIMISWGVMAALTALSRGPASFLLFRFLLGATEAGFFPGIILYLTYWFPAAYRARVISALFLAVPGSNAVTAAASAAVLKMDGLWGVPGWQWLYVVEALPAVLLAFVVLAVMTERPADAAWLDAEEKAWLEGRLAAERQAVLQGRPPEGRWAVLFDRRALVLAAIYLTIVTATYGITFFLPLIINAMGASETETGLLTAVPYLIGTVGMVLWAISSDRRRERRWHYIVACLIGAGGLALTGFIGGSWWALAAMSVATIGIYGAKPSFWPLPSEFLTGTAAAGGIALVNSIGNLGGFVGPYIVGWIKQSSGGYEGGLYFLAGCAFLSAVIAFFTIRPRTEVEAARPYPEAGASRSA